MDLFSRFRDIKKQEGMETVDSHIHPFEVLGIPDIAPAEHAPSGIPAPTLLERLRYNPVAIRALKFLFAYAPGYIQGEIRKTFAAATPERLIKEMDEAGIDQGVMIPIAPAVTTERIAEAYSDKRFIRLGTIDLNTIRPDAIEPAIRQLKEKNRISGLKLHPNFQRFYPEPTRNSRTLEEKLLAVYEAAERNRLYLLFHGGISLLPGAAAPLGYAALDNFFDASGNSRVFSRTVPIIIAHAGNYNVIRPRPDLIRTIAARYSNVYFDTSGVAPAFLARVFESVGFKRIIFGSDAHYFRIRFGLVLVLRALSRVYEKTEFTQSVVHVFGRTYRERILAQVK